jgi:hypothetical protein
MNPVGIRYQKLANLYNWPVMIDGRDNWKNNQYGHVSVRIDVSLGSFV